MFSNFVIEYFLWICFDEVGSLCRYLEIVVSCGFGFIGILNGVYIVNI